MRRWLFPLLAAVLTSGVGIAINVATDLGTSVLAWAAVGVLTLATGVITMVATPSGSAGGNYTNNVNGTVKGSSLQARDINGPVTFSRER